MKLANNNNHKNELLAGLMYAKKNICGYSVYINADLQNNIGVVDGFIKKYNIFVNDNYSDKNDYFKKLMP